MKRIIPLVMLVFSATVLVSCGTGVRVTGASKEDKDLFKAINAIEKSNHAEARKDLPGLYQQAVARHEDKIASYKNSSSPDRWEKIVAELEALQKIYKQINASPATARLIPAQDYSTAIREARENGAAEYYDMGVQYLQANDRQSARKAYDVFRSVNRIHPNYRNTSDLMREAREMGILDVVINPIRTTGYAGYMWGNSQYSADNFQRNLVRELGGSFGNISTGARFYTDWEARSRNVNPDWVVDLNWENLYISTPRNHTYTRNVSKEVEIGRDTSGKAVYRTVNATLYITQITASARADMEYRISDLGAGHDVEWSRIPTYLDFNTEYATYRGDSRALSQYDWALINNSRNTYGSYAREEDVMDALYARVYSQLRSRIEMLTRW